MDKYTDVIKQFRETFIDSFFDFASDVDSVESLEKEIVKRDKKYTELLKSYVNITQIRNVIKEIHKWLFFWIIAVSCVIVLTLVYKTITRLLSFEDEAMIFQSIPIFISAFVSCITAVVAIPLTITKFLFNAKEDDNIANIIQHMQEHDMKGIRLLKDRFYDKENKRKPSSSKPNKS